MSAYRVVDVPQRSPEWFAARLGRVTGSRASDLLATIKTGEAAARRDYRAQLVCERLTGTPQEDGFINPTMQRGIDLEAQARAAYEAQTGLMVQQTTGFLAHTALMAGCSLDGHVGDMEGIVEIKCPKSATHLRYLKAKTVPPEHLAQITHNLWLSEAEWADFVSYDDRFPARLQLIVMRVMADTLNFDDYEAKLRAFLGEVDADLADLSAL